MGFFEYAGLQGESRLDGGFADGRWILMDPTWDSGNYYRDGKYQTSDAVHTYFDSTVEFFLLYYRQSCPDAYDSGYVKRQFTDIDGHWAFDPIRFVTNNDLMAGVDSGRFEPDSARRRRCGSLYWLRCQEM